MKHLLVLLLVILGIQVEAQTRRPAPVVKDTKVGDYWKQKGYDFEKDARDYWKSQGIIMPSTSRNTIRIQNDLITNTANIYRGNSLIPSATIVPDRLTNSIEIREEPYFTKYKGLFDKD